MSPAGRMAGEVGSVQKHSPQASISNASATILSLHMNHYLVDRIVKIAARIPHGRLGLNSALTVRGAGHDHAVAGNRRLPAIAPQPPRVTGLLVRQYGRAPVRSSITGNFDFHNIG